MFYAGYHAKLKAGAPVVAKPGSMEEIINTLRGLIGRGR